MKKLRLFLIKLLMTRRVVAVKANKLRIKLDNPITHVGLGLHTLPNRVFASINVHYESDVESFNYDNWNDAIEEFQFAKMVFEDQKASIIADMKVQELARLSRKAK